MSKQYKFVDDSDERNVKITLKSFKTKQEAIQYAISNNLNLIKKIDVSTGKFIYEDILNATI